MIDEKKLIEEIKQYHESINPKYISKLVDAEIEDILDIINSQPKVGEWIPCKERLPQDGREVLVCVELSKEQTHIIVGFYIGEWLDSQGDSIEEGYKGYKECFPNSYSNVIAWQELPEPYKGEQQ